MTRIAAAARTADPMPTARADALKAGDRVIVMTEDGDALRTVAYTGFWSRPGQKTPLTMMEVVFRGDNDPIIVPRDELIDLAPARAKIARRGVRSTKIAVHFVKVQDLRAGDFIAIPMVTMKPQPDEWLFCVVKDICGRSRKLTTIHSPNGDLIQQVETLKEVSAVRGPTASGQKLAALIAEDNSDSLLVSSADVDDNTGVTA